MQILTVIIQYLRIVGLGYPVIASVKRPSPNKTLFPFKSPTMEF